MYPLALHDVFLKLAENKLEDFKFKRQCGILIHFRPEAIADKSITWRVYSSGREMLSFTANLTPVDETSTKVEVEVSKDPDGTEAYAGGDFYKRPALLQQLLPAPERRSGMLVQIGVRVARLDCNSDDRAACAEVGAYELLARVEALLRRSRGNAAAQPEGEVGFGQAMGDGPDWSGIGETLELIGKPETLRRLDAALQRKPQLILVDELAHTNVPGSRHKRRNQDIAELLKAGINVYTTLNVQHIESLNDVVLQITGVRVQETVPDSFIDQANEIVFIDLPPQNLIERLQQGKVYVEEYARSALEGFFSPANLTALRELAMKIVIEHVDDSLKTRLDSRGEQQHLVINDKLLVLISNRSAHDYLIRIGRRLADVDQPDRGPPVGLGVERIEGP